MVNKSTQTPRNKRKCTKPKQEPVIRILKEHCGEQESLLEELRVLFNITTERLIAASSPAYVKQCEDCGLSDCEECTANILTE